jgi:hypothetical protein
MTKKELKDELYKRIQETEERIDYLVTKHNEVRDNVFEKLSLIEKHLGIKFEEEDYIAEQHFFEPWSSLPEPRKVIKQRLVLRKIKK